MSTRRKRRTRTMKPVKESSMERTSTGRAEPSPRVFAGVERELSTAEEVEEVEEVIALLPGALAVGDDTVVTAPFVGEVARALPADVDRVSARPPAPKTTLLSEEKEEEEEEEEDKEEELHPPPTVAGATPLRQGNRSSLTAGTRSG